MKTTTRRGPVRAAHVARAIAVAAAIACFSSRAHSQTAEPPRIEVTPKPQSLTAPTIEGAEETIRRTPGGVNVVPADDFREGRAVSLPDIFAFTPGIYAQTRYSEEVRLSIRGSGIANNNHLRGVKILQDGIPFNLADGSGDFQELDPLVTRYVEVYRGANALQYGSSYLGGAINAVSPTGYDADRFLARFEAGSYRYQRAQLALSGRSDGWDYFASPTITENGGVRNQSDVDTKRLATNVGYRLGPTAETRFYLFGNDIENRVPGSLTRAQALSNPRMANPANIPARASRNIDSARFANKTTFLLDETQVDVGLYATDRVLFHPLSFGIISQPSKDFGLSAKGTTEGALGEHRNRTIFGTNLAYGHIDARQYANLNGNRGALQRFDAQTARNVEVFAENQFYVVRDLALVAGAQALRAERRSEDRFLSDGNDSGSKTYSAVSPKAGVLWDVAPQTQVFSNVSRSYEPPRFSDLNPSAAPGFAPISGQSATTIEAGTRGRVHDVGFDVALYRAWLKDELQVLTVGSSATQTLTVDHTIHQGIELGLDVPVAKAIFTAPGAGADTLKWRQVYNYSDFTFDGDRTFGDNRLPVVPEHLFRGELRYEHKLADASSFYIAPNFEWVPKAFYVDNANTTKSTPYAIFGLKAGYRINPKVSLFVDGRNLADKTYIADAGVVPVASASSAIFNPGEGRTVIGGIEMRW